MFILTKNKIENEKIREIEKVLISKKTISLPDSLIINNPNHLKLIKNFNILDFNYLYEVNDYIVKENSNLLSYIKDKDFEYILKTLTNTHEDNAFTKEILGSIISSGNSNIDFLTNADTMIQNLVKEIYLNSKDAPGLTISKLREKLNKKTSLSELEKLELKILKNRATRWTLLKISKKIKILQATLKRSFEFSSINDSLENQHNYIYLSEKEYSSIFENTSGQKNITSTDLFTGYRYRDLKDFKDGSAVNYKKLKHIYIASNNYILRKLSYSDFLRDELSTTALNNMLRAFNSENIDIQAFNFDFLEEVISNNHDEIKTTISSKFIDLVDDDLKELFIPDDNDDSTTTESSGDILSFISKFNNI